jgi:DNA-directed RNA polymerase subunit K/omega
MKKNIQAEVPEVEPAEKFHTTDSLYRGVVMACLRSKQLINGAAPRTTAEFSFKRKSTAIAIQEIKQGLVGFELIEEEAV